MTICDEICSILSILLYVYFEDVESAVIEA